MIDDVSWKWVDDSSGSVRHGVGVITPSEKTDGGLTGLLVRKLAASSFPSQISRITQAIRESTESQTAGSPGIGGALRLALVELCS